jgi:CheY-like chemotaxis protein
MRDMIDIGRMVKASVPPNPDGDLVLKSNALIVDDESAYGEAMKTALLSYGFDVHVTHSATEALRVLKGVIPDVILLDIMMPEVDGLMLLRLLRTDPTRAHIPVIVISAQVSEEAKQEALSAGADRFLEIPFSIEELELALDGYVELNSRSAYWMNRTARPPRPLARR